MRKGVKKKVLNKSFFNKKETIIILVILILVIVGAFGYFSTTEEPQLSGHPNCSAETPQFCECEDGIDNDGDGGIDRGTTAPYELECLFAFDDPAFDEECFKNQALFKMSAATNAHASLYDSAEFLPYTACLNQESLGPPIRDCTGTNTVIRIFQDENSHIEDNTETLYPTEICFGALDCQNYEGDCSDLGPTFNCIASVTPNDPSNLGTNLHVGVCDEQAGGYPEKICCQDGFQITTDSLYGVVDLQSTVSGVQLMIGDHTFSPNQFTAQGASYTWSYSEEGGTVTIAGTGTGSPTPVSITIEEKTYNWVQLEVTKFDGTIESYKTDQIIGIPVQRCGNGILEHYGNFNGPNWEECDNGGRVGNNWGCSADCKVEENWECSEGISWLPELPYMSWCTLIDGICGNGVLDSPAERCDGNLFPAGVTCETVISPRHHGSLTCKEDCLQVLGISCVPEHNNGAGCFVGDTVVLTPEGNTAMEDLKVGDLVTSLNPETGELEPAKITKIETHVSEEYLVINGGLKVTPNHPMVVNGKKMEIGDAKVGDELSLSTGAGQKIFSIEKVIETTDVYNIVLENNNNYFTGSSSVSAGSLITGEAIGGGGGRGPLQQFANTIQKQDVGEDNPFPLGGVEIIP